MHQVGEARRTQFKTSLSVSNSKIEMFLCIWGLVLRLRTAEETAEGRLRLSIFQSLLSPQTQHHLFYSPTTSISLSLYSIVFLQ